MTRAALECSFCGKKQGDVRLIAGPRGVYICNLCVALCAEVLAHDTEVLAHRTPPTAPKPPEPEARRAQPEPPATDSPAGRWVRTVISS